MWMNDTLCIDLRTAGEMVRAVPDPRLEPYYDPFLEELLTRRLFMNFDFLGMIGLIENIMGEVLSSGY